MIGSVFLIIKTSSSGRMSFDLIVDKFYCLMCSVKYEANESDLMLSLWRRTILYVYSIILYES